MVACSGASSIRSLLPPLDPVGTAASAGRTFQTASVEGYGGIAPDLIGECHPLAEAAATQLHAAGWTGQQIRDAEVGPQLFHGQTAYPDLLLFAGHGTCVGPRLPGDDIRLREVMDFANAAKPVRWFLNDSCLGLSDLHNGDTPRWAPLIAQGGSVIYLDYLGGWFRAVGWGQHGTHAYFAHRAISYGVQGPDAGRFGSPLAITQSLRGMSLGRAWFEAAEVYVLAYRKGLEPAVLAAYDPTTGRDYFEESLANPWPDPDPATRVAEVLPASGWASDMLAVDWEGQHANLSFHASYMVASTSQAPNQATFEFAVGVTLEEARARVADLFPGAQLEAAGAFLQFRGEAMASPSPEALAREIDPSMQPDGCMVQVAQQGRGPLNEVGRTHIFRSPAGNGLLVRTDSAGRIQGGTWMGRPEEEQR